MNEESEVLKATAQGVSALLKVAIDDSIEKGLDTRIKYLKEYIDQIEKYTI